MTDAMTRHSDAEILAAFVDGHLDCEQLEAVSAHLAACEERPVVAVVVRPVFVTIDEVAARCKCGETSSKECALFQRRRRSTCDSLLFELKAGRRVAQ